MEQFKKYLEEKKYYPETIKRSIRQVNKFVEWLESTYQWSVEEMENVEYKHLLDFVQHEKSRGMCVRTLKVSIGSISQYFEYLKSKSYKEDSRIFNPARTLRIKGAARTVIENPLKYDELEKLYHSYKELKKDYPTALKNIPAHIKEKSILVHQRNTIIVGLLVYQALTVGELERLNVEDINLTEGTVYIAGSSKSNNRTLKLHTGQVLPLYSYLHGGTREKLKAMPPVGASSTYRQEEQYQNSLLVGKMYGAMRLLLEQLKGINPQIKTAHHIRASVILVWLRQYNKRQVQYMAGHKYIDSTEKYAVQEMDTLTDALTKYHPFG